MTETTTATTTKLIGLSKAQVALANTLGASATTTASATWNEAPEAVALRFEAAAESAAEAVANADSPAKAKQLLASIATMRRYIVEADTKHLRVEGGPTLEDAADAMKPEAPEAPAAEAPAPAKATKSTKAAAKGPAKSDAKLHMACPDCGFKFTKPQAKCRVASACASRQQSGGASKGKGASKATKSAAKSAPKEAPAAEVKVPTGATMVELDTPHLKAIGEQLLKSGAPIKIISDRLIVQGGADWEQLRSGLQAAIKMTTATKQVDAAATMQRLLDAIEAGGRQSVKAAS